jgi:preprotein translocase subunit SecG
MPFDAGQQYKLTIAIGLIAANLAIYFSTNIEDYIGNPLLYKIMPNFLTYLFIAAIIMIVYIYFVALSYTPTGFNEKVIHFTYTIGAYFNASVPIVFGSLVVANLGDANLVLLVIMAAITIIFAVLTRKMTLELNAQLEKLKSTQQRLKLIELQRKYFILREHELKRGHLK